MDGWQDNPILVKVVWDDATNIASWMEKEDVLEWLNHNMWVAENVGYLIYEDSECVVVASRKGAASKDSPAYGLVERIPKRMVKGVFQYTDHVPLSGYNNA